MSLRAPVTGRLTLAFGQSYPAEPRTLYHQEYRGLPLACFPSKFPGADPTPQAHYHDGMDWGAPLDTPILAPERCKVVQFGTDRVSGALYVYAAIRPNTRVEVWHLSKFRAGCAVGLVIPKGGVLGYVGSSGWSTGPHLHLALRITERDPDLVTRAYYYNPALFMVGGILANDARVAPYY